MGRGHGSTTPACPDAGRGAAPPTRSRASPPRQLDYEVLERDGRAADRLPPSPTRASHRGLGRAGRARRRGLRGDPPGPAAAGSWPPPGRTSRPAVVLARRHRPGRGPAADAAPDEPDHPAAARRCRRRPTGSPAATCAPSSGRRARRSSTSWRSDFNQMVRRLAEREGRAREFLMRVTHDLRTPLTAIRGHAAALSDGVVPPRTCRARSRRSRARRPAWRPSSPTCSTWPASTPTASRSTSPRWSRPRCSTAPSTPLEAEAVAPRRRLRARHRALPPRA